MRTLKPPTRALLTRLLPTMALALTAAFAFAEDPVPKSPDTPDAPGAAAETSTAPRRMLLVELFTSQG